VCHCVNRAIDNRQLPAGLPDRNKKLSSHSLQKIAKLRKIRQTSGNGCIFTETLIFSLEISHLKLFYLTPCIFPESIICFQHFTDIFKESVSTFCKNI